MFVIIAGGGRTGVYLAKTLLRQDHEVRVIELRESVLSNLCRPSFRKSSGRASSFCNQRAWVFRSVPVQ